MFFLRRAQLLFISTTDERRDTTAVCDATTQIVKIVINWKKLKLTLLKKGLQIVMKGKKIKSLRSKIVFLHLWDLN